MTLFRLKKKCGNHIGPPDKEGNRITYKAGDVVSSDDDLIARHPSKFELKQFSENEDGVAVATAPDIPWPAKRSKKKKKTSRRDEEPEEGEYGVDVTEEFSTASEVGLQVFEKSKWFTVIDPEDDEVLNEKKLRKDKVEAFLASYLQDGDGDDEDIDIEDEDED